MKKIDLKQMKEISGGQVLPEVVIIFQALDAWCGIQRIYVEGELLSMRLICD